MKKDIKRKFKILYFPTKSQKGQTISKTVSIAFNNSSERNLYNKVKKLTSTEIKNIISIFSYTHLFAIAEKEKRKITELIKIRLMERLFQSNAEKRVTVLVNVNKIKKWIASLNNVKLKGSEGNEIREFLSQLI